MVKAIFLDVDGTLRDERRGVPKSAVTAIFMCRQRGIQIVICTGRNLASIQRDVSAIHVDGLIAGGGCYLLDGNVVRKDSCFSKDEIKAVMRRLVEGGLPFSAETKDSIFMNQAAADWFKRDMESKLKGLTSQERKIRICENRITYGDTLKKGLDGAYPVHKFCIWIPPFLEAGPGLQSMAERTGVIVQQSQVRFLEGPDMWTYLEMLPKGCSKGAAVREWCGIRDIDPMDTMSFGDGKNDIDMLAATGIGIAMADGDKELKKSASAICGTAAEDGIYNELLRRGIIKMDELI